MDCAQHKLAEIPRDKSSVLQGDLSCFKVGILLAALLFSLSACDDSADSNSSLGGNTAPTANAGVTQTIRLGTTVTLDGSHSADLDGDELSYYWHFESLPEGSGVVFSDDAAVSPSFSADVLGDYRVGLIVNDGQADSTLSLVTIIAQVASPAVASYAIVDTMQTDCYQSASGQSSACSGAGHDADYSGNQLSYTVSDDGQTVLDNVTGLLWQQSSDITQDGQLTYDDKLYQSEALSYCRNLELAGRDDWRLPDIKEAYSLILFSGKDPSSYQGTDSSGLQPFLAHQFDWAFGDLNSGKDRLIDGQYASSTLYVSATMNGESTMFGVNYVDGRIKGYPSTRKEYYVRCVTGNTAYGINEFVDNGDSTISDKATDLMWQQDDSDSVDWPDAISQCESATTASYTDWRLPNVKELQSIVDYSRSPDLNDSAAIDPLFNSSAFINEEGIKDWAYYWSSTTHLDSNDNGSNAAYLAFGRALGYMHNTIMDVHGAGSQRSDDKLNVASEPGAQFAFANNERFYYKGPQGDILRNNNKLRCVRDLRAAMPVAFVP